MVGRGVAVEKARIAQAIANSHVNWEWHLDALYDTLAKDRLKQ